MTKEELLSIRGDFNEDWINTQEKTFINRLLDEIEACWKEIEELKTQ